MGRLTTTNPAIVLDSDQRSALAVTRSLGRRGIAVTNVDAAIGTLASGSRFSTGSLVCPSPASDPVAFGRWLAGVPTTHAGNVLFACTDASLPPVLESGQAPAAIRTCVPPVAAYVQLSDKWSLYQAATAAGVPVPATRLLVNTADGRNGLSNLESPVVVKPRQSVMNVGGIRQKLSVRRISDPPQLGGVLEQGYPEGAELLVQQVVKGAGFGLSAVCSHGMPLAWFAHRRIREKPPGGGVSTVCESIPLPRRYLKLCQSLVEATRWHGPIMFEFKGDPDGEAWLIEVNGRLWGSVQLAIDCGVDVPWMMYRLALGEPVEPVASYEVGRRMRWLVGDLSHLYMVLRNKGVNDETPGPMATLARVLLRWDGRQRIEDWRYGDFSPFWHQLRRELGSAVGSNS
jgi:predicted ATP-grasp superfamily ATP-dependent carboligase